MKRKQAGEQARNSRSRSGRREEKKEETKRRILAAALHLFRTKGFEKTTAREISARAKIAEGTLFNYFPTKEDLALYFFQRDVDDLIEWYSGQTGLAEAPLQERLFAIIHHQLEQLAPYEDFIGSVFFRSLQPQSKLGALSPEANLYRARYLQFIGDVLRKSAENKEIPFLGEIGSYGVGLFYVGIVSFWLHDKSEGKQKTLALLDRSLATISALLRGGKWEWT